MSGTQIREKTWRRQLTVLQKSKTRLIFCIISHIQWLRVRKIAVPEAMCFYTFRGYYAIVLYNMAPSDIPIPNQPLTSNFWQRFQHIQFRFICIYNTALEITRKRPKREVFSQVLASLHTKTMPIIRQLTVPQTLKTRLNLFCNISY